MTLSVFEEGSFLILGVRGKPYKVGPRCANPTCSHWADDAHHLVRRSALGGDYAWIRVGDTVHGNLVGLCRDCHEDVTGSIGGYRAAIRFIDGEFMWCAVQDRWGDLRFDPRGPLQPQPPTPESLATTTPRADESESESCPTCGHSKRRRGSDSAPGPRRARKTWTVKVPDDQENGAEVLDTMVDDLALELGFDDERSALRRYHTLVPVLYWAQQNKVRFLEEIGKAVA